MISFTKPQNLNGKELIAELHDAGVKITDDRKSVQDDGHGNLLLEISAADQDKAAAVVAAHNGTTIAPEPTVSEKLLSVGLSIDDLKAALGL